MASTVQEQHDELQGSSNSENASLKGPSVDSTGLVDDAADLNNAGEGKRSVTQQFGGREKECYSTIRGKGRGVLLNNLGKGRGVLLTRKGLLKIL